MADTNKIDDTRQRFNDAKTRYQAMMQPSQTEKEQVAGDVNKGAQDFANLFEMLAKSQNNLPVAKARIAPAKLNLVANDNKIDVPIPLPVRPIEPETIINQEKTNDLLTKLQKTVIATSLPQPVKIDDENLAHEATLQSVVDILGQMWVGIQRFTEELYKTFVQIFGTMENSMIDKEQQIQEQQQGVFSKMFSKLTGYFEGVDTGVHSIALIFAKVTKPLVEKAKKTVNYLKGIYELTRADRNISTTERARALVEDDDSAEKMWFEKYLSKDSDIGKILLSVGGIFETFKNIGKIAETSINNRAGTDLVKYLSNATGIIGLIGKFLGVFGGIAGVVATVVGSVAFASLYAFFKNPDQMVRLFDAFGKLFTDAILPALVWINKEIIPPLTIAFTALMIAADYLLDTVGTYVNDKLIYIIGTALPDVLRMFGRMIDTIWQSLKEVFWRIAGAFGVGPYGQKSLFENVVMGVWTIVDSLLEVISIAATEVVKSLGLADFFGLKEGEGLYGRLKRFFMVDIPNFAIGLFNDMVTLIQELNPLPAIKKKIEEFTEAILSIIPSWQDMKTWIADTIPSWVSDDIRNWMLEKLDVNQGSQTVTPVTRDTESQYNAPISSWDKAGQVLGTFFYAPVNAVTNNSSVSNTTRTGAAIGHTRPASNPLDDMITKANPY